MTDHRNGRREQGGYRKKEKTPLQRKHDVGCVQKTNDDQEGDQFRPRLGRWFLEEAFFLQLLAEFCHWMCTHVHHQRQRRSQVGQPV